jgi:tripartite-type tricarboxylate transporter receptor subunit TctC
MKRSMLAACLLAAAVAQAQPCPDKNLMYWQAFPPGGESDLSARHQQLVLKKKCGAIDTVIQYKPGAGGALLWSSANTLPADGLNIVGINLPHMVLQPMEGNVTYKTDDVTPVFWYHYTLDALVVPEQSPIRSCADSVKAAKEQPGKLNLGGSGLNSANHAAHQRMNAAFGFKTTYVPCKGTGDMTLAVLGGHVDGSMIDMRRPEPLSSACGCISDAIHSLDESLRYVAADPCRARDQGQRRGCAARR